MKAGTLMTTYPVTVTTETTVAVALDLMRRLDVRHLPVVERGALVGIVSDRDLASLGFDGVFLDQGPDGLRRTLAMPVLEVMQPDVACVRHDTELSDVIELLLEQKVGAIPVVHPDTRAVVGIISYLDALRAAGDLFRAK
jgi:acetoin utilization protein AcuB